MTYHDEYRSGKSVVIGRSGTIGNPQLIEHDFWPHNTTLYVKDFKNNNIEYIYYLLLNMDIGKMKSGSNIPTLNRNHLHPLEILAETDIEKQKNLARVLKAIDNKIENNNKVNIELESMAKTIYDYWFLQFEFPNEDGKPYKSSGGKMVWNEELKREIPAGWQAGNLNMFIKQDKGGDWGKGIEEAHYTKKVTCLRGADFPAICGIAKLNAPERYIHEKNTFKILNDGDLIIEISGGSPTQSTGRICYINDNTLKRFENEIITSNFCKAICLVDKEYMYWFYILWCRLYENGVFFKYEGKTTGIKNLLFEMLCEDYLIVIPNIDMIKEYNNEVRDCFMKIQSNQLENQELTSLRAYLLPLLMNGQLGFKD